MCCGPGPATTAWLCPGKGESSMRKDKWGPMGGGGVRVRSGWGGVGKHSYLPGSSTHQRALVARVRPAVYVDLVSGSRSMEPVQWVTLWEYSSVVEHLTAKGHPLSVRQFLLHDATLWSVVSVNLWGLSQFVSICLMVSGDFLRFWPFIESKLSFREVTSWKCVTILSQSFLKPLNYSIKQLYCLVCVWVCVSVWACACVFSDWPW